jgi:aminoglycoside phosphotransferase
VPDVLDAYDDDGAFVLVTQRLPGVRMDKLCPEDQAVVMKEVESHIQALQNLRSTRTGGPSGLVCPPQRGTQYFPKGTPWSVRSSPGFDFVFCHCDLSQSNIMVDPETLKIEGIIDWEYAGYWPAFFESPFFRNPRPSGAQFRDEAGNCQFIDFLHGSKHKAESNA